MRKTGMSRKAGKRGPFGLSLLSAAFLAGAVLGCWVAGVVPDSESGALTAYVEGYLSAARAGERLRVSLPQALWQTVRWPGLVFCLSFTAAGLAVIPVVFAVRGFLLCFAVSCLGRVMGGTGAALAGALFGVTGLFSLTALFLLGVQGMSACRALAARLLGERGRVAIYGKDYFSRCALCAGLLLCGAGVEWAVLPGLLQALAEML